MRPPGRIPVVRRLPSRLTRVEPRLVLFDSWRGKYSDSPRAISEELHRRDPSFRHVWVVDEHDPLVPDWVEVVRPNSWSHLESLGRAQYIVANSGMPIYWRKKAGQRYLQTWHGTPLKKIAFDIQNPQMADASRYLRHFSRDVQYWDLLLSQNPFSTKILRGAFRYEGSILESGYPRNDLLSSAQADDIRERTRQGLGLDRSIRAILYAPTWRDNGTFELELDLGALAEYLGPETVFLLRAHNSVAGTVEAQEHPRVLDVSMVPDIRELLLAADVLITDYSSVMFDFAITRRPILLFGYDIEYYRDSLRGMYLDLEQEAPMPVLQTPDELLGALRQIDQTGPNSRTAYEQFVERFAPFDDGAASARTVEAFFGGD
jgi:CDP-glycerol glycerophosphotransferase